MDLEATKSSALRRWPVIATLLLASACDQLSSIVSPDPEPDNSLVSPMPPADPGAPAPTGQCAAPANWGTSPAGAEPAGRPRNTVLIGRAGVIQWNGTALNLVTLRQYLDYTTVLRPTPAFILEVEPGAPCDQVSAVVAMASQALNCPADCTYRERAPRPGQAQGAPGGASQPGALDNLAREQRPGPSNTQ